MNLINTSGLAIIGPGSEWFWSMAQFFAVVVTLLGIYRQLKAQGAANGLQRVQFLTDQWLSDKMTHARLAIALHLKFGEPGPGMDPVMDEVANFWETIAQLRDDGYIRLNDVDNFGRSAQMWWALMRPAIEAERVLQRAPIYNRWERLAELMRESDAKAGVPFQLDEETLPGILDEVIRANTGALQKARDFQSGVIPTAPQPAVATEPA